MRSREFDLDFRDQARRTAGWGVGLLAVAALLWAWCAVLLLTPYEVDRKPDDKYPAECAARLFADRATLDRPHPQSRWCAVERDWPGALALLGLSVPFSVAGGVVLTVGLVSRRMSAHGQAMRELDRIADSRTA
ncbi:MULTISPECIES: hypothetical protein [unclassified Streptomyces]|uniref:hypothetical protein n=1 Tax=unclassified Streptomyces TaxID=2593676 RepID=UPI0004C3BC3C